jgi:hypothetical protein
MKVFLKELKILFPLMLLGAIYGSVIGCGFSFLTGNDNFTGALIGTLTGIFSLTLALVFSWLLFLAGIFIPILFAYMAGRLNLARDFALGIAFILATPFILASAFTFALCLFGFWSLIRLGVLKYLAQQDKTSDKKLLDRHIQWILSLPTAIIITLIRFFSGNRLSGKFHTKSPNKLVVWDISLIAVLSEELTEVFPEEWDDWQHWINDMIESRTRMQSEGMNHRFVSLITFYRLTRFVWHIGIDKVFILATRRTTR